MQQTSEFGSLLKDWRQRRRMSQLDLALEAEISSRHLSFIETGRSRPTRSMVLKIAARLEIPLRECNTLLLSAGHAPEYREAQGRDAASSALLATLSEMIGRMAPLPALIVDGGWNLLAANPMIGLLIAGADPQLLAAPINVLRLSLHAKGLAGRIRNLGEWHTHVLERLDRQCLQTGDRRLQALAAELRSYPVPDVSSSERSTAPAVTLQIDMDGTLLSLISTTMVIGGPRDIVLAEMAIEMFLPADEATRAWLESAHKGL
uniref:helix-turn-helix domain-containing protein n=1 Tax=uncultured Rhizobium sp. TaxID=155567 RepID=UPI00262803E4|nr:helix-turn-helix transcriptional regulator [uncultured Rhizobium sp.]